jgi:hypothetical protein
VQTASLVVVLMPGWIEAVAKSAHLGMDGGGTAAESLALAVVTGARTAAVTAAAARAVLSAVRRNSRFELIDELLGSRTDMCQTCWGP